MAQRYPADSFGHAVKDKIRTFLTGHPVLLFVLAGVIALGIAFATSGVLNSEESSNLIERSSGSSEADSSDATEIGAEDVYVDVAGAVASPGVVKLTEGDRIDDAISAAGGLSGDADVSQLNRASKVTDGLKVYVPRVGESSVAMGNAGEGSSTTGGSGLVSINTASQAELESLTGIGPSTAQSIIDDRAKNGPFSSLEDLMRVSGIGEKKFANLKDSICL